MAVTVRQTTGHTDFLVCRKMGRHRHTLSSIESNKTSRLLLVYRPYVCPPVISLFHRASHHRWSRQRRSFCCWKHRSKHLCTTATTVAAIALMLLEDMKFAARPQINSTWIRSNSRNFFQFETKQVSFTWHLEDGSKATDVQVWRLLLLHIVTQCGTAIHWC